MTGALSKVNITECEIFFWGTCQRLSNMGHIFVTLEVVFKN
jgi:hypothetical protein